MSNKQLIHECLNKSFIMKNNALIYIDYILNKKEDFETKIDSMQGEDFVLFLKKEKNHDENTNIA